jgi:hypothetical protein
LSQPSLDPLLRQGVKVSRAHILLGLLPGPERLHDHQNGVSEGDKRTFLTPPGRHALVVGRQLRLLGFGRHMGDVHQHLASPSTALAGLAAEALAPTVVMAGAHARPGGQMLGTREPCHVGPDFGQQDLRRPLTDPRNRVQEGHRLLLGL